MLELPFTEIAQSPPAARVNKHEHLLADTGVGTFGNRQVSHARIEGSVNAAVLQIVAGALDCGLFGSALAGQRLERGHSIGGLLMLCLD